MKYITYHVVTIRFSCSNFPARNGGKKILNRCIAYTLSRGTYHGLAVLIKTYTHMDAMSHTQEAEFLQELHILHCISHANIVKLHAAVPAEGMLVLEGRGYHCSLQDILYEETVMLPNQLAFNAEVKTFILCDVLKGLWFLTARRLVYGALCPRNIWLFAGETE